MRKLSLVFLAVFLAWIAVGYFYRGEFGRDASIWLIGILLGLMLLLKLVQIGLQRLTRRQEADMSPEQHRDFEEYKRQV